MAQNFLAVDPTHQYASLLSKCIAAKNIKLGMLLHSHFIKTALIFNPFLCNRLIEMYSKCGTLEDAQKAFDNLPAKNNHSWNAMISAFSRVGRFRESRRLLDEMPEPNVVSFNSLISGYTHHGFYRESISLFRAMQRQCDYVVMDGFTLVSVLGACACMGALELLRQVHGLGVVTGVGLNSIICNCLIDTYGKCGKLDASYSVFSRMPAKDTVSWTSMVVSYVQASRLDDACRLFIQMPVKNTVSWTSLIMGLAKNGRATEALALFGKMRQEKVLPSSFTFVGVLSACSDLALIEKGKQIHAHIIRSGNDYEYLHNVFLVNSLVDMYCKCGDMASADKLFKRIHERDIVSWNSLITGFAHNGRGQESLLVYKSMIEAGFRPNDVTFLGVLSACCHMGLIFEGLQIIKTMEKKFGVIAKPEHYAILIDLLGRKNKIEDAMDLIERAPKGSNWIGLWGAVLGACQIHGNSNLAFRAAETLFELEPENAARYVVLSNLYAVAGRWDDADRVWKLMEERGLNKETAFSWIEVGNKRHEFVARDRVHSQARQIYEVIHNMVDQMKDAGYVSVSHLPCKNELAAV